MNDNDPTPRTQLAMNGIASVSSLMQLRSCAGCGVTYAVPGELLAAIAASKGRMYCPNGHAAAVSTKADRRDLAALAALAMLQLKLQNARLARLERQVTRAAAEAGGGDVKPIDADALRRRYQWLAARANWKPDEGVECPFCGNLYRRELPLRRHMKYAHAEQVKALPASHFH